MVSGSVVVVGAVGEKVVGWGQGVKVGWLDKGDAIAKRGPPPAHTSRGSAQAAPGQGGISLTLSSPGDLCVTAG